MAAAPGRVGRMNYESFGNITKQHRLIHSHWPVTFSPPSKLSVLELHTLHSTLFGSDPPALFRKLTDTEWKDFLHALQTGTTFVVPEPPNTTGVPARRLLASPNNPPPSEGNDDPLQPPPEPARHEDAEPAPPQPIPPRADPNVPPPPGHILQAPRGGAIVNFGESGTLKVPKTRQGRFDKQLTPQQKKAAKAEQVAKKKAEKERKAAETLAKNQAKAAEAAAKKAERVAAKPWLRKPMTMAP